MKGARKVKLLLKDEYSPFFGKRPICGLMIEIKQDHFNCPLCGTSLSLDIEKFRKVYDSFNKQVGGGFYGKTK